MTQSELDTKLKNFIAEWNGRLLDIDGIYGAQCFDLIQTWNYDLGGEWIGGMYAYEIYNQKAPLYEKIPNTPDAEVEAGDIVVWKKEYNGWAGHTAVAKRKININTFEAFSQNDPTGAKCGLKVYSYANVRGWLRPKLAVVENNMDSKKAIQFDRVLNYLKEKDYITDNDSNHYLEGEFLDLIKHLYEDYKSNRERAGKWDNICLKAGITTDSNKVSVDQVYEKLYKAEVVSTQSEQLLNLRKENEALSKKLEESIKLVEQKEALRAKWYSLYETSKDNFETCKQGNATLQKKLTECQNKQDFTVGELVVRLWNKVRGIKI